MPKVKRIRTKYPGVYYVMGGSLGGNRRHERIYYIRYRRNGKEIEEKAGRQFQDDMTAEKASRIRSEIITGTRLPRKKVRERSKANEEAFRKKEAELEARTLNPEEAKPGVIGKLSGWGETNRKKTEEALRQSEERLSLALQATKDGIWDWDIVNGKNYASESLKELIGYKGDDSTMRVEDWASNIHPDHYEKAMGALQEHLSGRVRSDVDIDFLYHRPGEEEYRWHNVRGKAFYDKKGNAYRMVGATRDINERKLADEALKRRETELKIQSANLEQANTALQVLLQHREKDREELEQKVLANVKELVLPFVEELKKTISDDKEKALLWIVESNLNEVISPFLRQLTSKYSDLTPKEIQVANLVKEGKTSKEIAQLLIMSKFTVDIHRASLRKKLGLVHTKGNLRSHLLSLK